MRKKRTERTVFGWGVACLFAACIGLFSACERVNTIELSDADDRSTQTLAVGDRLQIALKGNPSTGYEWNAGTYDASVLKQEGEREYEEDPRPTFGPSKVGAGGTYTFRFRAVGTGRTVLFLVRHRSWESQPGKDIFRVNVVVE